MTDGTQQIPRVRGTLPGTHLAGVVEPVGAGHGRVASQLAETKRQLGNLLIPHVLFFPRVGKHIRLCHVGTWQLPEILETFWGQSSAEFF